MTDTIPGWLWIVFTLLAAGGQTLRNAMQRGLTETLGTAGATHVRFLFGLPFALLFLAISAGWFGLPAMTFDAGFIGWLLVGALAQILATAWMLSAMRHRSFVVTTAVIKTEPIQVAVFAAIFLGERIGLPASVAVVVATVGVLMMSWPRQQAGAITDWRPVWLGVAAGGMFALSSVGYRGAILALELGPYYSRATVTLACGLTLQAVLLSIWLRLREPGTLAAILRAWRPSVVAGFMGAFASQMWFLAFAIESVARVRTLALVEIFMAQLLSRKLFAQRASRLESAGIWLIVGGVILLLNS
ncbi:MAG: DMT family transporter [Burkholderiaceae bacterium]